MTSRDISVSTREYELAFLAASGDQAPVVFDIIEKAGGALTYRGTAVSIRLAYPIKKQTSAFFAFCTFTAPASAAHKIRETLARRGEIIRSLLITPPQRPPVARPRPANQSADPSGESFSPALTNEALEQKLEEILK